MRTQPLVRRPLFLAVFVAIPLASQAQGAKTIDEGSFTITVNGQRVGREDFSIAGTPTGRGTEYIAKATIVMGDRRLMPAMQADSSGAPMTYQIQTRSASDQEWWSGTISRGRVDARMRTAKGEARKEYIVTDGAIILDDDVFHQYFFVVSRVRSGSIPVVIPRRNTQLTLAIASAGPDRVTIAGKELDATHYVLTEPSGTTRDLWVDGRGLVLKVAIPSRGVVALRDDPPAA
ncbi:MAG: hypothetical protein MNPFHGCM_00360 [Gemmatimonadaceae bacterium]|nr:hypothetical protein [Gemmatimonadaceae bacterium]